MGDWWEWRGRLRGYRAEYGGRWRKWCRWGYARSICHGKVAGRIVASGLGGLMIHIASMISGKITVIYNSVAARCLLALTSVLTSRPYPRYAHPIGRKYFR